MFVIKRYITEKGLSEKLHNGKSHFEYEVKGPLGENLKAEKSGLHIAFTSGTGVLPLMDLVAHLLFTTMGLNGALGVAADDCVGPDFRLKLFVSFASRKDAVALTLLEAISDYFKHLQNPTFELVTRISNEKAKRWDDDFVKRELQAASR